MRGMIGRSRGGAPGVVAFTLAENGTHVAKSDNIRISAFTLAEVLITLAIIGVVAVLTIPTLVANYQEKGWNTAATVFERKLEESLKIMNTQGTLAGYKTTEEFVSELQKHLKITKVCKNDDILSCFEDTVMFGAGEAEPEEVDMSTIKKSKHFGQEDWGTNVVGLQLNNGTSALIAYNPECKQDPYSNQITGTSCVAVLYDTSGYTKPNTSGKDLRAINITQLGRTCAFEIRGTCYGAPFTPTYMTLAQCAGENAASGGTYPKPGKEANALGIKNCYYDPDYWAGAVKACGGVNKMPTLSQLAEIANYIYNTDKVEAKTNVSNLTRDNAKASSLGFTVPSGSFYIWSGDERNSSIYAYGRSFAATSTSFYDDNRNRSHMAVCIID